MLIRVLTLATVALAASLLAACSGPDNTLRNQIAESVAPYKDTVDFEIIIPSYLPEGTMKGPTLPPLAGEQNDKLSLTFYRNEPDNEGNLPVAKRPARIEIGEGKAEGPAPTPDPNLEEIYGVEWERLQFRGLDVFVTRSEDPGSAYIALQARMGQVDVGLSANWSEEWSGEGTPPVMELTPEMEEEFFKIFESMMEG